MWCHRRAASRTAGEGHNLASPMQQTSVERWLEEQNAPSEVERYAQDIWYVSIHLISFTCRLFRALAPRPPSWLSEFDDVMWGMPKAGPWILLPYNNLRCFRYSVFVLGSTLSHQHMCLLPCYHACRPSWTELYCLGLPQTYPVPSFDFHRLWNYIALTPSQPYLPLILVIIPVSRKSRTRSSALQCTQFLSRSNQ